MITRFEDAKGLPVTLLHSTDGSGMGNEAQPDVVVLKAADLLPERQKCIRTEEDVTLARETGDSRFCQECLLKPCRWWNGWRDGKPRVAPPEPCGACGMKHYPDEPGFTKEDCSGWQAPLPTIAPNTARALERAVDDDASNKTQQDFKTRRKLFDEVGRQIRAVVRGMLPGITLEFKQQLDKDLGLAALRARAERSKVYLETELAKLDPAKLGARIEARVEGLAHAVGAIAVEATIEAFTEEATNIVAGEVARQLAAIGRAVTRHPAPKKKRKRHVPRSAAR